MFLIKLACACTHTQLVSHPDLARVDDVMGTFLRGRSWSFIKGSYDQRKGNEHSIIYGVCLMLMFQSEGEDCEIKCVWAQRVVGDTRDVRDSVTHPSIIFMINEYHRPMSTRVPAHF